MTHFATISKKSDFSWKFGKYSQIFPKKANFFQFFPTFQNIPRFFPTFEKRPTPNFHGQPEFFIPRFANLGMKKANLATLFESSLGRFRFGLSPSFCFPPVAPRSGCFVFLVGKEEKTELLGQQFSVTLHNFNQTFIYDIYLYASLNEMCERIASKFYLIPEK